MSTAKGTGAKVLFGLLEGVCFLNKINQDRKRRVFV